MHQVIITGKPGSGKTTLLNALKAQNFKTVNCDTIVNQLYQFNHQGYKIIKKLFGDKFVDKNCVNKKALWKSIVDGEITIDYLNQLIHPLVNKQLQTLQFDFCECPIIGSPFIDYQKFTILKLDVDDSVAIKRLMDRKKISAIEAKRIVHLFQNNIKTNVTFNTTNGINDTFVKKVINFYQSL